MITSPSMAFPLPPTILADLAIAYPRKRRWADLCAMEIIYALVFFLDLLAICGLGFLSFREIDNRGPAWDQALLVIALVLAIVVMVLFIRHYLRRDTGPNDN